MKNHYLSSIACMLFAFMLQPVLSSGQLSVQTSNTNVSCNGGSTGSATATPSDGTTPYTYSWSDVNNQTTATATGLSAGTYTITVTDNVSATASAAVTITEPDALSGGAFDIDNEACFGDAVGKAEAFPNGGTSPYTYSWSPDGETTAEITGLTAGTYTVTISDSCGASETYSASIQQPSAALSAVTDFTQASCNNANGTATVTSVSGGWGATPYTYLWSDASSQTTPTATGLTAGTYTVTVQDLNGCSATATASVTQPPVPIVGPSGTDVTCNGGNDGTANANPGSGVSPYTYSWSDGSNQSTATATGLSAGTYTVTVSDNNGCTASGSVSITQPSVLSASPISTVVGCIGGNNGTASANLSGGTSPYTYSWSDGLSQTTATATGLSAGTYTLTIGDACGGSYTASVAISQPSAALSASTNFTQATCDNANGTATVTSVNGGWGATPYTYLWNDASSQTTATATGLMVGTYTVTVQDLNGCSATSSVSITEPSTPIAYPSSTNVTCIGGSNGTASANPTGGVSPYTYSWNDGSSQTTATATGLSAGTYTVIVNDNNGCNSDGIVSVNEPNTLRARTPGSTASCSGNATGTATEGPLGGTSPYTYLWSDGSSQSTATATGLSEGTYTVTVTDNCGDPSSTASVTIRQFTTPTASVHIDHQDETECANIGSITVTPGGGNPPYTYRWNPSSQSTATASGLGGGTYSITVTDQCGNSATAVATITQPPALVVTPYTVDSTADSSIAAVTATGGVPPYTFSWSPGGGTIDTIYNLTDGVYTCTTTDALGCSETTSITIATTGVNGITSHSASILVYPNPNNGQFTIKLSAFNGQSPVLEVYNMLGEQVLTETLPNSNGTGASSLYQMNLSSQANGVYLYRILTDSGGLVGEGKLSIQK